MEKFSTFFGLKLGYLVFSITERLSCTLEGKDTTIQEAVEAAKLTVIFAESKKWWRICQILSGRTSSISGFNRWACPSQKTKNSMTHQWWSWSSPVWNTRGFLWATLLSGFRWSDKWTIKMVSSAGYQNSCWSGENVSFCCMLWQRVGGSRDSSENLSKGYPSRTVKSTIQTLYYVIKSWLVLWLKKLPAFEHCAISWIQILLQNHSVMMFIPYSSCIWQFQSPQQQQKGRSQQWEGSKHLRSTMTQERLNHLCWTLIISGWQSTWYK